MKWSIKNKLVMIGVMTFIALMSSLLISHFSIQSADFTSLLLPFTIPALISIVSIYFIGREILKYAIGRKMDLIIIGSRGPYPSSETFLGSVANYILHKSSIPITIVK